MRKESIIDIKSGNIYGKGEEETIILKGYYLYEDSNYAERVTIAIKDENNNIEEYPIKVNGYNLKVFFGKFLVSVVMIYISMEKQVNLLDMQLL